MVNCALLHVATGAGVGRGGLVVAVREVVGVGFGVGFGEDVADGVGVAVGVADTAVVDGVALGVGVEVTEGGGGGLDVDRICPAEVHAHVTSATVATTTATKPRVNGRSAGPSSTAGS